MQQELNHYLDHGHFFFLVITTVLIAAGGYVINDVIDYETDLINKPDKVFIGEIISKKNALILYWVIGFSGALIAWFLAGYVEHYILFLIYPAAVLLLYFYSKTFKKIPLLGNLIVSVFCAGVAGIILFAERYAYVQLFETMPELAYKITSIFIAYILFAFISTFLREIIKDIEDVEGDKKTGMKTFPIVYGIENAKKISILIAVIISVGMACGCIWLFNQNEIAAVFFSLIGILIPLFFIVKYLIESSTKKHFSRLSRLIKLVMLSGLLLLILIWKF